MLLLLLLGFVPLIGIAAALIVVVAQLGSRPCETSTRDRQTSRQLTAGCLILLAVGVGACVAAIRLYAYK